jgi:hypothetical protein
MRPVRLNEYFDSHTEKSCILFVDLGDEWDSNARDRALQIMEGIDSLNPLWTQE